MPAAADDARAWIKVLMRYRDPLPGRAVFEIAVTLLPFLGFWGLAWASLDGPRVLTLGLALLIGFFLMRIFCLHHDCGHGALFEDRKTCDRVGRCLAVLTITPYATYHRMHACHHQNAGNLDGDPLGEVITLTVDEYRARGPMGRMLYRFYRHPVFLLVIAPFALFFLQYRLPFGLMRAGAKYWISTMGTNLAIAALLLAMYAARGVEPILWIFVPSTLFGAFAGIWTFYVHHQFDGTQFYPGEDWQLHEAALHGSSQLVLPAWLQWITANITIHHVHHLYSRIPFYRLPEVLADYPELAAVNRITLRESLAAFRLSLWDTQSRRLVTFKEADALP